MLEVVWTMIAVIVVVQIVRSFWQVLLDLIASGRSDDRAVHAIAFGYVRRELVRYHQGLLLLAAAIYADTQPPLPGGHTTYLGLALQIAFILVGIGVGLQTFMDSRQRTRVSEMLRINGVATPND